MKSIIIAGSDNSGKLEKAMDCISQMKLRKDEYTTIDRYHPNDPFQFAVCSPGTKAIIVDNVKKHQVEDFFNWVTTGLTVKRKFNTDFTITPRFILVVTINEDPETIQFGASVTVRFDVIITK